MHSIAFAEYEGGVKPFHETGKREFLRAVDISCYSLMAISRAFQKLLEADASVVTISISTTRMASENYGYMHRSKRRSIPHWRFLPNRLVVFSRVRFNAVSPGLLKLPLRQEFPGMSTRIFMPSESFPAHKAVQTEEVANAVAFLLSPRSSGINAQQIIMMPE